ncbi:MAG: APC family permease [bacterium]
MKATNLYQGKEETTNTKQPTFFTRKATGLVRQLSLFDAFVFNASFVNIGLAVTYMALYVPAWHPGGSMILATFIAMLIAIPTAITYGMLAAAFPRSGGEYVYISRNLSPVVGFAASWNLSIWGLFYIGAPCALFSQFGLTALFRFIAVSTGSQVFMNAANWVATPTGTFLAGTCLLIIIIAFYIRGMRVWARIQDVFFVGAVVSIVLIAILLFFNTRADFAAKFNQYLATVSKQENTYDFIISKARENGYSGAPFSLVMTLLVLAWPCYNMFWANASTYFGGEVRQPARTQVLSLPLAVLCTGTGMIIIFALLNRTIGNGLLASLGWIKPSELGLGFVPPFHELCAILGGPILGALILIGFLYWTWAWAPLATAVVTRNFLAWSLDGLAPNKLSEVNPRLHTPVAALVTCGGLGVLFLALYSFVPQFALLVGVIGVFTTFALASASAVAFPFKRKSDFEASPVNAKLGNIPVISIMGALSVVFLICAMVAILLDPVSGIGIKPSADEGTGKGVAFMMLLINIAVFASGFVVYFIAKAIQKARGRDIALAFKEIPPE